MREVEFLRPFRRDDCLRCAHLLLEASIQITTALCKIAWIERERSSKKNKMQRMTKSDFGSSRITYWPSHGSEGDAMLRPSALSMLDRRVTGYSSSICMPHGDPAVSRRRLPLLQSNHHRPTLKVPSPNVVQSRPVQIRGDQNLCGGVDISLPCHRSRACR
jgi:hypothetical protein